ncbi:hypothetical protein KA005_44015, partial [bacterium]|nr:hypothetical protein [bacterium]
LELIDVHRIDLSEEVEELRKEHDSDESILAINLVSEEANSSKIPQLLVWVAGHEDINSISLDNGLVILKIPEKLVDKPLDIRMADPFTEYDAQSKENKYNWYATNIIVPKGRILEVILTLPFLGSLDREDNAGINSIDIIDDEAPSSNVDLSQSNIPFRENSGGFISSSKSKGAFADAEVEEVMDALRGSEDNTPVIPINSSRYSEATVHVSEDGKKTTPVYVNKRQVPIWVVDGFENLGKFIQGSSHPIAVILKGFGGPQEYGPKGNTLPLHVSQIASPTLNRFLGNEIAKANLHKVETRDHIFLGSGNLKLKYAGNESWVQMDTDNYVSTIKTRIGESAERMQYMGEELDAAKKLSSEIGLSPEELRTGLIAAMNVIQNIYNEEEINRTSLKDSIENVMVF